MLDNELSKVRSHPEDDDGWQKWGLNKKDIKPGINVYVPNHGPGKVQQMPVTGESDYKVGLPDGSSLLLCSKNFSPLISPKMKLEFLARKHDDERRKVSPSTATFNLVATIIGGGVLSLPYAISQCGLALGCMALLYSAYMSSASIDILVFSARRTGKENYMELAFKAYGECALKFTSILIFLLVWMALIAYDVLIGDLLTSLLETVVTDFKLIYRKFLILGAVAVVLPWCYKASLNSLRYLSAFSVFSISFVSIVLVYRAAQNFDSRHKIYTIQGGSSEEIYIDWNINLWPTDWQKALYVFPVFGVAFICHFNVLPTHTELKNPTKARTRQVMNSTIGICVIIYAIVGISGYLWSLQNTCGNILLNFGSDDYLVTSARVALTLVLMVSYPLIVHPTRNTLHQILCFCFNSYSPKITSLTDPLLDSDYHSSNFAINDDGCVQHTPKLSSARSKRGKTVHVYSKNRETKKWMVYDQYSCREERSKATGSEQTPKQRFWLTTFVLVSNLTVGLFLDAIMIVWTILGATIAFTIAFILPSLFFLKMHFNRPSTEVSNRRKVLACFMVVTSTIFSMVCTVMVIMNLDAAPCPAARS